MNRSRRPLLTVLLVVALAAVSAVAIAYRSGVLRQQAVLEVATTGDLRDLFSPHEPQGSMLANVALRKLESDYYKPIDPQTPIAGESAALRALLTSKKLH